MSACGKSGGFSIVKLLIEKNAMIPNELTCSPRVVQVLRGKGVAHQASATVVEVSQK